MVLNGRVERIVDMSNQALHSRLMLEASQCKLAVAKANGSFLLFFSQTIEGCPVLLFTQFTLCISRFFF